MTKGKWMNMDEVSPEHPGIYSTDGYIGRAYWDGTEWFIPYSDTDVFPLRITKWLDLSYD